MSLESTIRGVLEEAMTPAQHRAARVKAGLPARPTARSASGYELYHKSFSDAMQHAYAMAKKNMGVTVDKKDIDSKVATGPRKPGEGKTNRYSLKTDKGMLQIQVYNRGGSKPFELNMYKEEVEIDEKLDSEDKPVVKKVVKMLKKASQAHAGQADDLEKSMNTEDNLQEMDPTKHVMKNKETGKYCVYNANNKKVAEFDSEDEANAYAKKNHDKLMQKEAVSPAQQAAIAISKKEKGEKPKNEDLMKKKIDRRADKLGHNPNADLPRLSKKNEEVEYLDNILEEFFELEEDAKMGKQSDSNLKSLMKKFKNMPKSPANDHMLKRIEKEMKKRNLQEGVWHYPDAREVAKFKKALGKKFILGRDKDGSAEIAKDIIPFGDDELYDMLDDAADVNPKQDARPIFTRWINGRIRDNYGGYGKKTLAIAKKLGIREEVEMNENSDVKRFGLSQSLVDAVASIIAGKKPTNAKEDNTNDKSDDGEGLDKVQPKALKKKFKDRKDKDIDNDGDVDDSDEYMHKKRQAVSKAISKDDEKPETKSNEKDDADTKADPKKKKKSNGEPVDTKPTMNAEEVKEEMTDAQMKKREEIVKELKKKEDYFKDKYGEKADEVMYATATKMAMKGSNVGENVKAVKQNKPLQKKLDTLYGPKKVAGGVAKGKPGMKAFKRGESPYQKRIKKITGKDKLDSPHMQPQKK